MRVFIIAAFILLLTFTISAQNKVDQGWESKPIDQWDDKDVKSIFESSAWGRLIEGETPLANGVLVIRPLELQTNVVIALRSALPIRFALVRHRQLIERYDAMSADAKAEFNKRNKPLVDVRRARSIMLYRLQATALY